MALFSKDPTPATRPETRASTPPPAGGTFIGANITVEGSITGTEPITIEGSVRGKITLQSDVRIGTKARIDATVHGRNVTVEGRINGDISADDRVELVATATVEGNIKAPKIVVAEGAKFRGNVDMGSRVPKEGTESVKAR
ncbi:MAG TPA: polymer-forming cytoskeletal protein [Thermoanaerobaculia bacterium]|jgi:cytoskeletal protein CcmA (bactofilin family)|nr:polymer-forming cytoskeletal protein [Thermoanaerobaculia bacterium]